MKQFFLLSLFVLGAASFSSAQFNSNPATPLAICNATNTQATVHAFSDKHGGYYTFWIDYRTSTTIGEVYGQHLTSGGNNEWPSNGRLIINSGRNILDFKIVPWQTGMLIAWMQASPNYGSPDSLYVQYIDTAGAAIWPSPILVANVGTNSIIDLETDGFNIFPNSLGATISYAVTLLGGADDFSFNRINFSGKLRWPINNFLEVYNPYYNYRSFSDGMGGVYGLYKGNGLGSPMAIQHFDTAGTKLFSTPIVFTANHGGVANSDQINFNLDVNKNLYITWDDDTASGRVLITKITPQGTFPWTPAYHLVSNFNSSQSYSNSILNGGKIYTIWDDDRPASGGNLSFYIQRTDTTGVNDWTPGGVKICNMNCYIPYPKIALSDSGSIIAFYETTTNGLYGQKIRPDTSMEYPTNGQLLVNYNQSPFYGDFVLVDSGSGCATGFWTTTSGDIYAAQLCSPVAITTGVKGEVVETALHLFPNPSTLFVNWVIPNAASDNLTLNIMDLSGRQVYNENTHASSGTIDVSTFAKGMYILQSVSGKSIYTRKLIVE